MYNQGLEYRYAGLDKFLKQSKIQLRLLEWAGLKNATYYLIDGYNL